MLIIFLLFFLGLLIIIFSGDKFVDSSVLLARKTGLPKMFIGATIVSFATTLPELLVSSISTFYGIQEMAIGNAIGSIICNTAFIAALPLIFLQSSIDKDFKEKGILLIISIIVLFFLTIDNHLSFIDCMVLFCFLIYFFKLNFASVKKNSFEISSCQMPLIYILLTFIVSCVGIILGSKILIDNGIKIALFLGIPTSVVSLTIVALGTSLPELTTTITSIIKKESSLCFGNILGANILNILLIISTCGIISKSGLFLNSQKVLGSFLNTTKYIDLPVALLVSIIFIYPFIKNKKTKKWQGVVLILIYMLYIAFQFIFVN